MDRLTDAFFKLKKVINNISLPEAKSAWEDGVLLNIDVYLNTKIIRGIVERAKIRKFLAENIGRIIEVRGEVNQIWRDSEKLELWRITVDGKMDENVKIMVMSKIPSRLRQGYTISVTGIVKGNNEGEWILSCDKLEMVEPTEKWLIEEEVASRSETISSLKEESFSLKKKIINGVTKKGKPYSERYMSILRNKVVRIEGYIKEEMELLDGLNNGKGVAKKTYLKLIKGGLT